MKLKFKILTNKIITKFRRNSPRYYRFAALIFLVIINFFASSNDEVLIFNYFKFSFRCMLRNKPFYISVLAPVAAILLVNLTVLLVVMVKLHNHGKRKQIGPFLRLFADIRIAFTCNVLLGCTWVFALFAVGKAITIFQWFFCIFNSLQGFFIFLCYVVRNSEVRNVVNRMLSSRSKYPRKLEEISTASLKKGGFIVFNSILQENLKKVKLSTTLKRS